MFAQFYFVSSFSIFMFTYSIDIFLDSLIKSSISNISYYFNVFLKYLFLFIFLNNLVGLLPDSYAVTSHLSSTVILAFYIWFFILTLSFNIYGLQFFKIIKPTGI